MLKKIIRKMIRSILSFQDYFILRAGFFLDKGASNKIKRYQKHADNIMTNLDILDRDYGWLNSLELKMAVDANSEAIPWFSYPCIEWLKSLDLSQKRVFEYGCGQSTFYWAKRAKELVAVERRKEWFDHIKSLQNLQNVDLILSENPSEYTTIIKQHLGTKFDIVVVDDNERGECIKTAVECLAEGGMIILDNAERYVGIHKYMEEQQFVRFDFVGFTPGLSRTTCTSCYLKASFGFSQSHSIEAPGSCFYRGIESDMDILDDL